jgi:hypothetical protein
VRRVVHAVLVENQRARQCADLEQTMPVGRVARESRYLEAHHDPGTAHADLGDQALETLAIDGRRAGLTEVGVDHDDSLEWPTERDRALPQVVLPLGALLILEHLAQCRLADIQVRIALEMTSFDLRAGLAAGRRSHPPPNRRPIGAVSYAGREALGVAARGTLPRR